jgi:hypothetical protein
MDLRGQGHSDLTFSTFDDPAAARTSLALTEHLGGPRSVMAIRWERPRPPWLPPQQPAQISGLVLIGAFVRDQPVAWQLGDARRHGRPVGRLAWMSYFPKFFPTRRGQDYAAHRDAVSKPWRARIWTRLPAGSAHVPCARRRCWTTSTRGFLW